jgi:hypothetical protein
LTRLFSDRTLFPTFELLTLRNDERTAYTSRAVLPLPPHESLHAKPLSTRRDEHWKKSDSEREAGEEPGGRPRMSKECFKLT